MIAYLVDLMEDATDFSWQGAKAAHAVLLCKMERGSLQWEDGDRIDQSKGLMPKNTSLLVDQLGPKMKKKHGFVNIFRITLVLIKKTMKLKAG